jgi:ATP-dependent protease ClpP protease subunit
MFAMPQQKQNVFVSFQGRIEQQTGERVVRILREVAPLGTDLHLCLESNGGKISSAMQLHSYFKSRGSTTIYAGSTVASCAVIAFLGAQRRKLREDTRVVVHRARNTLKEAIAERFFEVGQSLLDDDKRLLAILKENIDLSGQQWDQYHCGEEVILLGAEAKQKGFAQGFAVFEPPEGAKVINLSEPIEPQ